MKLLLLGGNGMMGPWAIKALEGRHDLRVTDVNAAPAGFRHEYVRLSIADLDGVVRAAGGMDAIVNLAVMRHDRQLAFDVSTRGNYNMMVAAREHGIRRIVNTGPFSQLSGPQANNWDFGIHLSLPPAPGTGLYVLSKALGQEVCRVFTERHDMYVMALVYGNLKDTTELRGPEADPVYHDDLYPMTASWPDAGEAIRCAVEIELAKLPSRCETFWISTNLPHGRFEFEKTERILGWRPRYMIEPLWNKAPQPVHSPSG